MDFLTVAGILDILACSQVWRLVSQIVFQLIKRKLMYIYSDWNYAMRVIDRYISKPGTASFNQPGMHLRTGEL